MPLAPALVQNGSQEWCTVSRRDASGTLVPIDGGQVVFSQNLHVLVQLTTNFDYTSLPLVVRRQSAVQSGSTQHGFVSAKHHGHKLVFTSHPYGKPNASAAITVELTRNAGPACPLSRSSSDPLASYETDSEIAMHIAKSCFCRRVPERSKSAWSSHNDSAATIDPAGGGVTPVHEERLFMDNVPVPSLDGLDLTILDELQQLDSSVAAGTTSSKPALQGCAPQMPAMPLPPVASYAPVAEANPQQSAGVIAAGSSSAAITWKMCYAKVYLRAADGMECHSRASAAEVPLAPYAHIIFKIDSRFRGECHLRVTRTFQHDGPSGAQAAATSQVSRNDESVMRLCVQSCTSCTSKGSAPVEALNATAAFGDISGAETACSVNKEDEQTKEAALRRALLSEMRLAERLRQMSCVVARVASVIRHTASADAARAVLQKFVREGEMHELIPTKSSLFAWAVHESKLDDGLRQACNFTVIRDDLYQPGLNTASSPDIFPHAVLNGLQRFYKICFPEEEHVAAVSHHGAPASVTLEQKQQLSQVRSASYVWPDSSSGPGAARNRNAKSSHLSASVTCARHLARLLPVHTSWGRCLVGSSINCERTENMGSDGSGQPSANDFHADQVVSYTRWTETYTQAIVAEFVRAPTLAAAHKALSEFHCRAKDVCCDVFAWRILEHRASGQSALSAVYHPLYTEPEGEVGIGCYVWPTLHASVRAAFDKFVQVSKQQAVVERRELRSGYCGGTALVVYDWPMFVPQETQPSRGTMRKICSVCLVNHYGVEYIVGCGVQCCEFAGRLASVTNNNSCDDVGGISVVSRQSRCPFSGLARHDVAGISKSRSFLGACRDADVSVGDMCPAHQLKSVGESGACASVNSVEGESGTFTSYTACPTDNTSVNSGRKRKRT